VTNRKSKIKLRKYFYGALRKVDFVDNAIIDNVFCRKTKH